MLVLANIHTRGDVESIISYVVGGSLVALAVWIAHMLSKIVKTHKEMSEQVIGRPKSRTLPGIPSLQERFDITEARFDEHDRRFDEQDLHLRSIDEHLATQDSIIERVEHEVLENDGSSVKDTANRTEAKVEQLAGTLGSVSERLDLHMQESRERGETAPEAKKASAI